MAKFTPELQTEYEHLFASCRIVPGHVGEVNRMVGKIVAGRLRYSAVSAVSEVPWGFIGLLHSMESGCSFTTHLHNGDQLAARTFHVPKGRPLIWNPPNDWESSAYDSLRYQGFVDLKDWSLARVLYRLEAFNGFGYRQHGIFSPYLWSYSQHYTKGKYVWDGKWDPDAVSRQCGAAVLLKKMVDDGVVAYPGALPGYRDAGASA
jgi:lysozyme family protein